MQGETHNLGDRAFKRLVTVSRRTSASDCNFPRRNRCCRSRVEWSTPSSPVWMGATRPTLSVVTMSTIPSVDSDSVAPCPPVFVYPPVHDALLLSSYTKTQRKSVASGHTPDSGVGTGESFQPARTSGEPVTHQWGVSKTPPLC